MVDLKQNIRTEVVAISSKVLRRVMRSLPLRLQECVENEGHASIECVFQKVINFY